MTLLGDSQSADNLSPRHSGPASPPLLPTAGSRLSFGKPVRGQGGTFSGRGSNFCREEAWTFWEEAESSLLGAGGWGWGVSEPWKMIKITFPSLALPPTLSTLSLNGGSCPGVGWNGWKAFPSIGNEEAAVPFAPPGMGSWPSR